VKKLNKHMKLREKLRGNRGSLRSHGGPLRNCMKFEEVVEIEVNWKIEEEHKIVEEVFGPFLGSFLPPF
jgi:hypothetical protein